uniref:ArsC/Spx/MgsR family protein n=1 Tax=Lactococcus garvieae TaxID=1363 RepID=UPI00359C8457
MVNIFTRYKTNTTTKKAVCWFERYNIPYQLIGLEDISEAHIKQILILSDGLDEILLSRDKGQKTWEKLHLNQQWFEEMSMNELMYILKKYPVLLKSLILFDHHRMLVGYNEEEIRIFLPVAYRRVYCKQVS